MALSPVRIERGDVGSYTWENDAIDFVVERLPDVDPYRVWALMEYVDATSGALYEIDLMVLTRQALFLVEVKSHPGVVTGDARDWCIEHQGRRKYMENPLAVTARKARVLASRLDRLVKGVRRPYVEPLVFLSNEDLRIRLKEPGRSKVVGRDQVLRALTRGEYPGSGFTRAREVNRPVMRAVCQAMRDLGLRASRAGRRVGEYQLGGLLMQGPGYQEHEGQHTEHEQRRVRIRSYLAPGQTSDERKARLERAARNEADVLWRLKHHRSILPCLGYHARGGLGPALEFELFDGGEPLDVFLHRNPELSFDERLVIVGRVAEALDYCHRHEVIHRHLAPASVLVRRGEDGGLEVRLHNFQIALQARDGQGTVHLTTLAGDVGMLYQAPEVLQDPTAASPASDVFGLGMLAWFVLAGCLPTIDIGERDRMLREGPGLRIGAVRDDLSGEIDEHIARATLYYPDERDDDALAWYDLLLDEATRPADEVPGDLLDPYEARPGDVLPGGFEVHRLLGTGGTSRVLHVVGDDRDYALKVPHDAACAERLVAESRVLERLHEGDHGSSHVVRSFGMRAVGTRDCLLLQYAGPSRRDGGDERIASLADLLRREGSLGLDLSRRYGHDLLTALQFLEERGVQHRDIKPGNVGFTSLSKRARHLVLIDFSLSPIPDDQVIAGTPAYRDPWLQERGRWDGAADRWAAAVVLYEMLTGTRPRTGDVCDEQGRRRLCLDAERFDAGLRDRLVAHFERAFEPQVDERFPSAEDQLTGWMALFADAPRPAEAVAEPDGKAESTPDPLAQAGLNTPIEALPLSTRARNALDRAGVSTVTDLLRLPRNSLSAVRGVGRKVAREIHTTATTLRDRLGEAPARSQDAFAPGFSGSRAPLQPGPALGASPEEIYRLREAGLTTTVDLANAPAQRVRRVIGDVAADRLREALQERGERLGQRTVAQWVDELLTPRKRRKREFEKRARALLGVDPLPGTSWDDDTPIVAPTTAEVARALKTRSSKLVEAIRKMRARWATCEGLPLLVEAVAQVLEEHGGALPLDAAADALLRAHGGGLPDGPTARRQAAALLRLTTELGPAADAEFAPRLARIHDRPWMVVDDLWTPTIATLGTVADELAAREPLAGTGAVRQALTDAVAGGPLAGVAVDRLAAFAVAASGTAALSPRMEIYPRGMAPERSLALSAALLSQSEIRGDELVRRVRARYPEATALPGRPHLDAYLETFGLEFDDSERVYRRRAGVRTETTGTFLGHTRLASADTHQPVRQDARALEAREFQRTLHAGVEAGRFRVVTVIAKEAEATAQALADELGVGPTSLDLLLWEHLEEVRTQLGVDPAVVIQADREGSEGPHWDRLSTLVRRAADAMVDGVLSRRRQAQLLVHPGALARFGLSAPLQRLVDVAERDEGAAILLVVPAHDTGGLPSINGVLPVPAPLPGQRLHVPVSWLRNEHRAPAASPATEDG